jgi:hypothetical protein
MRTVGLHISPAMTTRMDLFVLATLSLGAAAIHFSVIGEHFAEYFLFGVFFSIIGWFEALWAVAFVFRPTQRLAGAGLVVNAATVMIWAWAHLVGLPFGPDPGQVEPTTITDLMATLFEIVLIVGLIPSLIRGGDIEPATPPRAAAFAVMIAAIAFGTTVALAQPPAMGG